MTTRREHVFYCGESASESPLPRGVRPLIEGDGPNCNLTVKISGLEKQLIGEIPAVYRDLLLIAVYTLTADQTVERGDLDDDTDGEAWRRSFRLRIPVSCPEVWSRPGLRAGLERTLNFLSDDYFTFEFVPATRPYAASAQTMFTAADGGSLLPSTDIGEVMMFSGGLDSFTGAHHQVVQRKARPVLVSHRSSTKMWDVQNRLVEHLRRECPEAAPIHVAVQYTKLDRKLAKERTQRTRSFLYASLGATVARIARKQTVTFYENGIVTFNLPVSSQLQGAKATRTTHPKVLRGFADLFTAIEGKPVGVVNPFVFDTRAEVMRRLIADGGGKFIGETVSCAHVHEATTMAPHCGVCSQCVDRRFAAEAAGCVQLDPVSRYDVDILNPIRKDKYKGKPISMAEKAQRLYLMEYVRTARRFAGFRDYDELLAGFGQATRAISGGVDALSADARDIAKRLHALHKRFGETTEQVLRAWLGRFALEIADGKMDASFLTSLVQRQGTAIVAAPDGTDSNGQAITGAEDAAPSPAFDPARPICRRDSSDIWWVAFPGESAVAMPHQVGFDYIALLVRHCGQEFTPQQLVAAVAGPVFGGAQAAISATADGLAQEESGAVDVALTEHALARLRGELADYPEAIRAAEDATDHRAVRSLREEEAKIRDYIGRNTDAEGRPKKVGGDHERARKSVCNAITRAVTAVAKEKPKGALFAGHLGKYIIKGSKISYNQQHLNWQT